MSSTNWSRGSLSIRESDGPRFSKVDVSLALHIGPVISLDSPRWLPSNMLQQNAEGPPLISFYF